MQRNAWKSTLLMILGLGITFGASIAEARLFKWQDENGKWHYGDSVPPQYADKERKVLNKQGVQVDTIERAKTPEEVKEEQELAEQKRLEEQRIAQEKAHDRMLLATFTSEDDMVMTRDGKIAAIDSNIRVTNGRIEKLQETLAGYTREAANLERAGKPIPDTLQEKILTARTQIQRYLDFITSKRQEQEQIRKEFEADINRFRELKQGSVQYQENANP